MCALRLMTSLVSMPTAPLLLLLLLLLWTVGMATSRATQEDEPKIDDDDVSARMRRVVDTRRVSVAFATPPLQSNEAADGTSGSGLRQSPVMTREQWQGRERSRQRRLFLIQQQLMASFGFRHRPNVTSYPRMSRGDIDRLVSDINSNRSRHDVIRKHPARRVFLLRPTCLMPDAQSDVFYSRGQYNNKNSSAAAGSGVDVESAVRLFFNVDALTGGKYRHRRRDDGVSVKSAVLRLHWTQQAPALKNRPTGRHGYHGRSSLTTTPAVVGHQRISKTMVIRRRRPPVNREPAGTRKGTNGPKAAGGQAPADGFRVAVYRLTKPRAANQTGGRKLIRVVHHRTNESLIQVNIKSAVEEWIKKPNKNYGLEVVVMSSRRQSSGRFNSNQIIIGFNCTTIPQESENSAISSEEEQSPVNAAVDPVNLPTLDVTVFQRSLNHVPPKLRPPSPTPESPAPPTALRGGNPRSRDGSARRGSRRYERDTSATTTTMVPETADNSECHVGTLVVSFEDMGWGWVIAPHRFTAGFCQGLCPNFNGNGSEMTTEGIAKNETLCCRPTKRAPLTLIFYDKDMNVSFSKLDDFIVTECGCTDELAEQPLNPIDAKFSRPCAS